MTTYGTISSSMFFLLFIEPSSIAFETLQVMLNYLWPINHVYGISIWRSKFPADGWQTVICRPLWFMDFSCLRYFFIILRETVQNADFQNSSIYPLQVLLKILLSCAISILSVLVFSWLGIHASWFYYELCKEDFWYLGSIICLMMIFFVQCVAALP